MTAHAQQRPLATEDPETIGAGRILVEGGLAFDADQSNSAYGIAGDIAHIATFGVSVGDQPECRGADRRRTPAASDRHRTRTQQPAVRAHAGRSSATARRASRISWSPPRSGSRRRPTHGPPSVRGSGPSCRSRILHKGIGLGTTDFFASFLVAKTVQSVRTVGNVGLIVLGNPQDAQERATALGFGVSVARAVTNAFEVVGEVNGRLAPFGEVVPAGLESRGVLRLAGRYTYAMLRLDFGLLAGITNRDPSFGISAGATYVITR